MKKMKKFFSMATLVLVGAMMTGCSSDNDSIIDNPQQPENKSKVVTLTTTVGFSGGTGTRALASDGTKTFADGDQMAVIYKNNSNQTIKTVASLTNGAGTSSGTFTVTLDDPDNTKAIRYIYPAAMAKETVATDATIDDAGTIDFTKLNSQNGLLTKLGSTLDLCTLDAASWTSGALPTGMLANQFAILAIKLKKGDDITSSITGMNISDGTNTYNVSGLSSASTIYVAIRPTSGADINVTATDGVNSYGKFLKGKTYEASNGYNVTWNMLKRVDLSTFSYSLYDVYEDVILTGTPVIVNDNSFHIFCNGYNYEVTLDNVNSEGTKKVFIYAGKYNINVKLKGTSRLTHIASHESSMTIDEAVAGGTVILIYEEGSPLDGKSVTINGGTVKAKSGQLYAVDGDLTVNGGAIYLAGGIGKYFQDEM